MTRPLTPEEKATLARFDKWTRKLFASSLFSLAGRTPPFAANVHPDSQGNLLIDSGRMALIPPAPPAFEWKIAEVATTDKVADSNLEGVLLEALTLALRRHFVNHY